MRFLLDENLSPLLCSLLTDSGHAATHVRDMAMASASDPDVLARAAADGLILITADRGDFGRELARTRATQPSVVLLRQLPAVVRATDVAALVLAVFAGDQVLGGDQLDGPVHAVVGRTGIPCSYGRIV